MRARKKFILKGVLLVVNVLILYALHQDSLKEVREEALPASQKAHKVFDLLLQSPRKQGITPSSIYSQLTGEEAAALFNDRLLLVDLNASFVEQFEADRHKLYGTDRLIALASFRSEELAQASVSPFEVFVGEYYPEHHYLLEHTYEKTISTDDIRLQTWDDEEILAEYLYHKMELEVPEGFSSYEVGLSLQAVPAVGDEDHSAVTLLVVVYMDCY